VLADRLLSELAHHTSDAALLVSPTAPGHGAYGRLAVCPSEAIEARLFGWPRLLPGHPDEVPAAIGVMLHLGFGFDGTDWVWRRPFRPELVPVAAHALGRAMAEAWHIGAHPADERQIVVRHLADHEVAAMAAGIQCERCAHDCGRVHHEGDE
jgi:hypothetical protein